MRKLAHALAFAAILFSQPFFAQNGDTCRLHIGTNLGPPTDLGSEFPFANLMKYGRTWIAHNNVFVPGGLNLWDTGFQKYIQYDADGYPLELPVQGIPGAERVQVVRTVWANTAALPAGTYTVQWDGMGELEIWGDVVKKVVSTNKFSFDLTPGIQNQLVLEILKSNVADHVRNVRILFPNTDLTYLAQPFNQTWLDKLEPFGTIRFMDWNLTDNNEARKWTDRTRLNDYTYTAKTGVPYEYLIFLCNQKSADAWVCIPHQASDDYIAQLALLFKNQLAPGLRVHVEYSNEVWNTALLQGKYGQDSLPQNLPWPERLAPRIEQVMQIWTNIFGNQSDRLVRVLGAQHSWPDFTARVFNQIEADGKSNLIDAISPSAYLGIMPNLLTNFSTGQEVLDNARHTSFDPTLGHMISWKSHALFAKNKGKSLLFYEGGQHFTPDPIGSQQPYCQALLDAQTLPGMYDIYRDFFDTLRAVAPGQKLLFMHHNLISPKNCQTGSWGALENQFGQHPPFGATAPKYQALLDEMTDCSSNSPCPWAAADVQGLTQVCLGFSTIYKTVQQANSYFWSVSGGTIQSGQGTNQIQVLWNSNAQPLNGGVGITLTTGNCTITGNIAISQSVLPAPWANGDIGSPTKKGDVCFDQPTGTLTVRGGGFSDIYGSTDRFHFVKQNFSGDFTLVARVASVQYTSLYAKAGIMVRETGAASSKNVMVGAMPNQQVFMQRRSATGGSTVRKAVNYQSVPKYLKITREGNVFKGWRSNDGTNWTLLQAATVAMANEVQVGLAVTSKNNVATCTGVFDHISLTAGVSFEDMADDRADFGPDEISETADFEVFPNPVGREFSILFSTKWETTARLVLSDMTGRQVFSAEMDALDGDNEWPVPLPVLPSGIYLLTLRTGDEARAKRVLVE